MLALAHRPPIPTVPQEAIADTLEELIKSANGNAWPVTRPQWRNVAQAYGIEVYLSRRLMLWSGLSLGNLLIVQDGRDHWEVMRTICHEVAHSLLVSELAPRVSLLTSHHTLARFVDIAYAEYLVFVCAAEEWREQRRRQFRTERARVALLDTTYERDEWSDPDFVDD